MSSYWCNSATSAVKLASSNIREGVVEPCVVNPSSAVNEVATPLPVVIEESKVDEPLTVTASMYDSVEQVYYDGLKDNFGESFGQCADIQVGHKDNHTVTVLNELTVPTTASRRIARGTMAPHRQAL